MENDKILIVDDDAQIRLGLNARLRASGYQTSFAEDGVGVMSAALREKPGFLVMKRLKQNSNLAHIPVIVLTAREPETNEKRALESGAVGFFQKPVDNDALLGAIATAIDPS
jgi:CheY-like chemotaxis protein